MCACRFPCLPAPDTRTGRRAAGGDTTAASGPITFTTEDGRELRLVPAAYDDQLQESVMNLRIEQVTISVNNIRNVAERNGKIDLEFSVTLPREPARRPVACRTGTGALHATGHLFTAPAAVHGRTLPPLAAAGHGALRPLPAFDRGQRGLLPLFRRRRRIRVLPA